MVMPNLSGRRFVKDEFAGSHRVEPVTGSGPAGERVVCASLVAMNIVSNSESPHKLNLPQDPTSVGNGKEIEMDTTLRFSDVKQTTLSFRAAYFPRGRPKLDALLSLDFSEWNVAHFESTVCDGRRVG